MDYFSMGAGEEERFSGGERWVVHNKGDSEMVLRGGVYNDPSPLPKPFSLHKESLL